MMEQLKPQNNDALSFITADSLPPSPTIPIPRAYTRAVPYIPQTYNPDDYNPYYTPTPSLSTQYSTITTITTTTTTTTPTIDKSVFDTSDTESLAPKPSKERSSVLIYLLKLRIYIRVLAIIMMLTSLGLIASSISAFEAAKRDPTHPLDKIPKQAQIIDRPCVVFSGIAGMNLALSGMVLAVSWWSSKVSKSLTVVTAIFTILSIIGFSSSMAACFFLNQQTTLRNDLWKWSCENHRRGITSPSLDFGHVCKTISYSWKFGLVQASLELFTFLVSVVTFVLLKYALFVRHGRFGKVF